MGICEEKELVKLLYNAKISPLVISVSKALGLLHKIGTSRRNELTELDQSMSSVFSVCTKRAPNGAVSSTFLCEAVLLKSSAR